MNGKNAKELRKSLRNVVQELLPALLSNELITNAYKTLSNEIHTKLKVISDDINRSLKEMEERQKNVQSLLVKEMVANQKFNPMANTPTVVDGETSGQ